MLSVSLAMEGPFFKYEGLGNDFVLVMTEGDALPPLDVARVCDRHFGVGADGVLFVSPARAAGARARVRVVNADGSTPEMCGNGVRCVALHLVRLDGQAEASVRLETDAGPRACVVDDRDGRGLVTVDMGIVRVDAERVVDVEGRAVTLTTADAGNPHAVLFGDFEASEVDRLGPRLATHAAFPNGTNVEFARVAGDGIELVVWERGVGRTLACGTGACATVAVAGVRGLVRGGEGIAVRLPGGSSRCRWMARGGRG